MGPKELLHFAPGIPRAKVVPELGGEARPSPVAEADAATATGVGEDTTARDPPLLVRSEDLPVGGRLFHYWDR